MPSVSFAVHRRASHRQKLGFAASCAISMHLAAADAHAGDRDGNRTGGSPYRLEWTYDSAFVALGVAGTMPHILEAPKPACYPTCKPPEDMLGIDEAVIGNYSPSARGLANVIAAGLVLAPMLINAADTRFDGWFEDTFVTLEAILLSQAITQLTKSAGNRTAPFVYSPHATQTDLDSPDAVRSFVSGHSSFTFAAATAYTFTFWKRHPASPWRFVVLGSAMRSRPASRSSRFTGANTTRPTWSQARSSEARWVARPGAPLRVVKSRTRPDHRSVGYYAM